MIALFARRVLLWVALSVVSCAALAQSPPQNPAMTYEMVPTVGQWVSWFQQKQDVLNYVPLSTGGGTMLGKLWALTSSVSGAGLNLGVGTQPSSPVNGDIWITNGGLYFYDNGTVNPASFAWKGAWNSGTTYYPSQAVYYNGSSYIALVQNTNVTPTPGATWDTLVQQQTGVTVASSPGNILVGPSSYNPANGSTHNLQNVIMGFGAGNSLVDASANTALGFHALYLYTGNALLGDNETALGYQTLLNDTTGEFNTGVGGNAGKCVSTAVGDTFLGHGAGGQDDGSPANCTGSYNVGLGGWSLQELTTGGGNTCAGINSCNDITTGSGNVAVGLGAVWGGSSGSPAGNAASDNVGLGYDALQVTTTNGQVAIGFFSLKASTTGTYNLAIGNTTLANSVNDVGNIAIGDSSQINTNGGSYNVSTGRSSMVSNTTGANNSAYGDESLRTETVANYDAAFGAGALYYATGAYNSGFGASAESQVTTGVNNVCDGYACLNNVKTGSYNVAVGTNSGPSGDYTNTIAIGNLAIPTASNQTVIGNGSTTLTILEGTLQFGSYTAGFGTCNGYIATYDAAGNVRHLCTI